MKKQYWIQEQAPNGGWFNSIGLSPSTPEVVAKKEAADWQKAFPNRKVRLALIITVPVE